VGLLTLFKLRGFSPPLGWLFGYTAVSTFFIPANAGDIGSTFFIPANAGDIGSTFFIPANAGGIGSTFFILATQ
jgi:hypothetical protein